MALTFTDRGIYCPTGDFYIDPWRPVERALITHGHADHARWGHMSYLCTDVAAPVIQHRLGDISVQTIGFGEQMDINGARVSFHPAGHVPGSAQIRVEVDGEVWVVSGDYKLQKDGLSEPFEPVRCHHFITECTFGLPVFTWAPSAQVIDEINAWWSANAAAGRSVILGAYGLGKAQRILANVDTSIGPILTHGAVEGTNGVLRGQGYDLPDTTLVTSETNRKAYPGALVIAPPSALGSAWARKFGQHETAFASGWMRMRGVRRRRAADRGFVMSDHVDWPELLCAVKETEAENIYPTHGYTDIFARYLNAHGWNANVVPTEFGGEQLDVDEADTTPESAA
ncbi:MAG: ligase-associated DNA damage response exonuclease [Marinovum sp.]|nr:ligase-associated DNA damage response exonuclease [Marinovum sp.]